MNYICATLECAVIAILSYGFEKGRKKTSMPKLAAYLAVYTVFYAVSVHLAVSFEASLGGYLLLFLYLKLSYREDFLHTLVVTVSSGVLARVIELLVMFVVMIVMPSEQEIGIFELVVVSLTVVVSVILSQSQLSRFVDVLEKWDFSYAIVAILSLMIFSPSVVLQLARKIEIIDFVYIVICIFMMWLLVFKVQRYKLESKIRRQYFEGYKDVIAQIRRRQHKIKNHIDTVYSMFHLYHTYDELVAKQREYLSRMLAYELPNDAITLEEPSIIALIYEKINEAAEQDIRVKTSFSCSMAESRISDVTWVELIGTLLDNAIEALQNYEGEKMIWLEIGYADDKKLFARVTNTFGRLNISEIELFFEMGFSTKGTGRGLGLYNIKRIVNRKNGDISAISSERSGRSVFIVEIVI